ncbi:hypothetical protein [Paraglaciecola hydrolytica]|uniref:hypothetical protein n=1 Tax=Paraglaciecola hydrolytica TaxID=1799789 RepID=UPI000A6364F1|nr:hypothetical protein [Paraglaciecola hydrolytica]
MIRFLFLLPVTLCLIWFVYLRIRGYSLSQGKQGFIYILVSSTTIAIFYSVMLWLTQR